MGWCSGGGADWFCSSVASLGGATPVGSIGKGRLLKSLNSLGPDRLDDAVLEALLVLLCNLSAAPLRRSMTASSFSRVS